MVNFKHFKTVDDFVTKWRATGQINDDDMVFIQDTSQIFTHGHFYDCLPGPYKVKNLVVYEETANGATIALNIDYKSLEKLRDDNVETVDIFTNDKLYKNLKI